MPINLDLQSSFDFNSPDGIVYDKNSGNLFVSRVNLLPDRADDWRVDQVTQTGEFVSTFTSPEILFSPGLSLLPNGNILLVDTYNNRVVETTKNGQIVAGGIDFKSPTIFVANSNPSLQGTQVVTSLKYDSKSDTIFAADFIAAKIFQLDKQGNLLKTIDLTSLIPDAVLRGIDIDPLTGNFLLSNEDLIQGSPERPKYNKLYEVTPSGQLVGTIDMTVASGFIDPEGISFDPDTRTLYAVFDTDAPTGLNEFEPNRNQVARFKLSIESLANDPAINDNLTGTGGNDNFLGGLGNDNLIGAGGNDILDGGAGGDAINGGQGNDQVIGGSGNDLARGGQSDDYISGGSGNDTLLGDAGNDTIAGDTGNDVLTGGAGRDVFLLNVGAGTDTIADFNLGQDSFGLGGGLTYDQITFTLDQGLTGPVLLRFEDTGEVLATVTGVTISQMTRNLFSLV